MAFPLIPIVGELIGLGKGWLQGRQRLREVKTEGDVKIAVAQAQAEITRLQKQADAEVDWDAAAVRQMEHSWKDEYLTLLLSAPMVLAFCGTWGRDAARDGFAAIASAPEWYKVAFLVTIAASFGIRALVDKFGFGKVR